MVCVCKARSIFGAIALSVFIVVVVIAKPQHHTRHQHGREEGNGTRRRSKEVSFQEHLRMVQNFRCQDPRTHSIGFLDLMTEAEEGSWTLGTGETVFPPVTVLHRCEKSGGCCLQGELFSCSPAEYEIVPLVFRVTSVISQVSTEGSSPSRLETVYAKNHTRCECVKIDDIK